MQLIINAIPFLFKVKYIYSKLFRYAFNILKKHNVNRMLHRKFGMNRIKQLGARTVAKRGTIALYIERGGDKS